jgi:hypothetical protein
VSDLTSISYGVLIVAFLVLEPRGLVGVADRLRSLRGRRAAPDFTQAIALNTPEEAHP